MQPSTAASSPTVPPTVPPEAPANQQPTFASRYCDWLWRNHLRILIGAFFVIALSVWAAMHLELRTNLAELLPSKDPAVEELRRVSSRIGGTAALEIAVESPDRDANLRMAAALDARLRALPSRLVQSVVYDVHAERAFFADHKWLYADYETLESLRDTLQSRLDRARNPLLVDLDDDPDSQPTPESLEERLKSRARRFDSFPSGYFEGQGGRIIVLVVRPPGNLFGEHVGEALHAAAVKIIDELSPARFHPQMKVGFTGSVMAELEERAALESDLAWATAVCVVLVCLVVILFYGRFRALVLVGIPALAGVAIAFGCAELLFGYLNSATAFLGSIVVGNGINFAIIQLARYEEERRDGRGPREAAGIALSATVRPTAVAALGAALAYGSLMVTRFRGFSQFGVIGGIGMIATWIATVVVLPCLWRGFDRRGSATRRFPLPGGGAFSRTVSHLATRFTKPLLALSLLLTAASVVPLRHYLADPFEYDFNKLRNKRSLEQGSAQVARDVDRVFGKSLTPAVIIADRREDTEAIRRKILERDASSGGRRVIGDVQTLDDFLPGPPAMQEKKLAVLSQIRKLIDDPSMQLLDDADRKKLTGLRPPDSLRAMSATDLPEALRRPFTESDGALGRIVLVYHDESVSEWDGRNLMRIASVIGDIPLDDGKVVHTSGDAVVFSSMIRSIRHDAPIATFASLFGVALLVLALSHKKRGAALVLGTLCAGVIWMLGAAAWLSVRTNFLNFIALPITFGIGVDYGINIHIRYLLEGPGRVERALRATGGAVALCSLTTIIGYGALLVADNQALRSFGEMAILGEVACLSAAAAVMPAFLVWREKRRAALVLAS